MIQTRLAAGDRDLEQILELQQANLARNLSAEEVAAQGFVTVEHSLPVLRRMHQIAPSVVAADGDALAGYALVMPVECRSFIPVLEPMFQRLDALQIRERFYVMGQICVAKPFRGQGVVGQLYQAHRQHFGGAFDSVITEVATRNTRSMRAHERVGFAVIERYRDSTDDWAVLRWDFR